MAAITSESEAAPAHKPLQALMMVPVVLAIIVTFIALNAVVGSAEVYAGFFFVLYWLGIQGGAFKDLPAAVAGSFLGLALAFGMHMLVARYGATNGALAFVGLFVPVLFCQLAGYLPLLINNATMLMLTAATISHVQAAAKFPAMFISLGLAVLFFGGLMALVEVLKTRAARRQA